MPSWKRVNRLSWTILLAVALSVPLLSTGYAAGEELGLASVYCSVDPPGPSAYINAPGIAATDSPFNVDFKLRAIPLKPTGNVCETKTKQVCDYVKQVVPSCSPSDTSCYCTQEERMCRGQDVCVKWNTYGCDNPAWAAQDPLCKEQSECLQWQQTYNPCKKTVCRKEGLECRTVTEPSKAYYDYGFKATLSVNSQAASKEYSGSLCLELGCSNYVANFRYSSQYVLPGGTYAFSLSSDHTAQASQNTTVRGSATAYPDKTYEIELPSENIELASWVDPFDYSFSGSGSNDNSNPDREHNYSSYQQTSKKQTFSANKIAGSNKYELDTYIFYRVLIYPDGREEVIDETKLDNHVSTRQEPLEGQPNVYQHFGEYALPEKTVSLSDAQPGEYKVEIRRITIPALTAEKNPNAGINSVVDLYDAKAMAYYKKVDGYTSSSGSGTLNSHYSEYSCTPTTNREYDVTGNFDVKYSRDKDCVWLEIRSIKNLGCRFEFNEYIQSDNYQLVWGPDYVQWGSSGNTVDSKNCWLEFLMNKSVRLKDRSETVGSYDFFVNLTSADIPAGLLQGTGEGGQPYSLGSNNLLLVGNSSPFVPSLGGAGEGPGVPPSGNDSGLVPLAGVLGTAAAGGATIYFLGRRTEGQSSGNVGDASNSTNYFEYPAATVSLNSFNPPGMRTMNDKEFANGFESIIVASKSHISYGSSILKGLYSSSRLDKALDASEGVLSIVDTVRDATKDLELAYPVIGASSRILRKTAPYLKSGVGRAVFPVIIALDIWSIGSALREDDYKFGRDTTLAVGETAGGWIGYFSGFYSGMAAGAIIGSILCPGPGTAIGAVGGAILGAVVGSALGSKIGEDIAERTYEAKPALLASLSNFKSKISKISLPSINIPKISPTGFINTVRENAAGFVEAAKSRIADLQERAVNNVNGVINTARNLQDGAVSTVEGVVNAAKNLEKKVTSPVSNVVNTVKAAVKNAAEKVINTANRIVNAAKNAVNNTVGIFKNWASGLFG